MHVLLDVPNKTRFTRPNSHPVEQTWNVPNIAQYVLEGEDVGKDAGIWIAVLQQAGLL